MLKDFENYFNVKENISVALSRICRKVSYERGGDERKVTKESIKIINQLFKSGIEVALFGEGTRIHDFAVNNCDNSKISIALLQQGHRRVNLLYNIYKRKRSDGITIFTLDYYKLNEYEPSYSEESKLEGDLNQLYDHSLNHKYNEIYPIIYENIAQAKSQHLFEPIDNLPPDIFNESPLDLHFEVLNSI
jgi:hypothetical protein